MRLKEDQIQELTKFILQNLDQYAVINPDPEQLCKLILILIKEDETSLQANLVEYFEENTEKFCNLLQQELENYQNKFSSSQSVSEKSQDNNNDDNNNNEEELENLTNSSDRNPLQRSDFSDDEEDNGRDSDSEPIVAGHKRYVQRDDQDNDNNRNQQQQNYGKKINRDLQEDKRNLKKVQRGSKNDKEKGGMPGMPGMMQQGPPLPNPAQMFQMRPGQQQMMPQMPMPMQYWAPYQFNQMPMFFPQPPFLNKPEKEKRGNYQKKPFQKTQKRDTVPDEIPKNQIYIKYIPDHYNSAERLKNFYQKFGKIINIQTNWKEKTSIVEFKKNEEAQAALNQKELLFGLKQIIVTQNKADLNKTHLQIIEERKQQEEQEKQAFIQQQKKQKPIINQLEKQENNNDQQEEKKSTPKSQQQSQLSQQQPTQQQKVNPILKNKVEKFQAQRDKKINDNRKTMILQKFTNQIKLVLFLKKRLANNQELFNELNDFYLQIQSKKEKLVKSINGSQELEQLIENEEKCKLFDFTLNIINLPETANYNSLIEQFEEFGKINQFKINQIQKTASLKYYSFESAEKAFLNTLHLTLEFADKNLSKYLVAAEPSRKESTTQVNEETKV